MTRAKFRVDAIAAALKRGERVPWGALFVRRRAPSDRGRTVVLTWRFDWRREGVSPPASHALLSVLESSPPNVRRVEVLDPAGELWACVDLDEVPT